MLASAGAKAFSVGCSLLQVPIALHYLQTQAYGFWATLFSLVIVLNFIDFGLGVAMQHEMARAYGADDPEGVRSVFWSGTAALLALGAGILAVGLPCSGLLPWGKILHLSDPALVALAPRALALALGTFVVALPFNAVARLAAATQRGWIHSGWIATGSALSLTLAWLAAQGNWGFLWFLAATLLVPFFQGLGLLIHLALRLGWGLRAPTFVPGAQLRRMLRSSALYAVPQFGLALVQSAPPLALSLVSGPESVTAFTLMARMFGLFGQCQVLALNPVWPAYTEALVRQDTRWIGRAFAGSLAATAVLAAGVAVAQWQSGLLFRLWIGPSAPTIDPGFAWLTAAWFILQMAAQPFLYYLMGTGRLRLIAASASPGLFAAAAALFWAFGRPSGTGVMAAGTGALAVLLLPALALSTLLRVSRDLKAPATP